MFDSFKKKKDRCNTAICLNKKKIFVNAPMIMTPDCMWSIYIFYYACIISHLLLFFFFICICFSPESSHSPAWLPVHEWLESAQWQSGSLLLSSQGYWVFFVVEGNGPLSSIYKALQVIDFYLGFILPCHPIFGMDVSVSTGSHLHLCLGSLADMYLVLAVSKCLLRFPLSLHWPVCGVDEGSCKHQTAQLDCPWNCRNRCGHLRYHGKTLDGPFLT